MYKISLILLIFFTQVIGKDFQLEHPNKDAGKIVFLTYNLEFGEALKLLNKHLSSEPNSLQWNYFQAMILFRKSLVVAQKVKLGYKVEEPKFHALFDSAYNAFSRVTSSGEDFLKKNENDTVALFYTGAAYGYIGIYHANNGDILKAASIGRKGLDYHGKLIGLSPHWGDVYLSKAIFNFYASNVPWYIKPILWILGRSGSEEEALDYFQRVIKNGKFARFEAMEMLAKLRIRQSKHNHVNKLVEELITEIPNSKYYEILELANEYTSKKEISEGNKLLNEAIQLSKKEELSEINKGIVGNIYLRLTYNLTQSKDYSTTINLWEELINRGIAPELDSWGHIVMGDCYAALEQKQEALKCYNWVIENSKSETHKKLVRNKIADL